MAYFKAVLRPFDFASNVVARDLRGKPSQTEPRLCLLAFEKTRFRASVHALRFVFAVIQLTFGDLRRVQ
jgi:hypothetical protein